MCPSAILLAVLITSLKSNADSTEEHQAFSPPSTVNFLDIYANSLPLLPEEPPFTATDKEEGFHISNMPTQFVEFRQLQTTASPSTTTLDVATGTESTEKSESSSTSTSSTTMEEAEESSVKVLPIAKNYQRGVLDLLFPANRVRSFKSMFDSFKRLLSHTFRR